MKYGEVNFMTMLLRKETQDINLNQLKLEVSTSYEEHEKITTKFEAFNPEDVINKGFSDKNFSKIEGLISYIVKEYNEYKVLNNKQMAEEVLFQKL